MSEARDQRFIEESRRQIDRLSKLGWYHSIELPGGSVIQGHQTVQQLRTRLRQFPIPEDLSGKRVLDIGAWDGWFSFEMERRGADVLALDNTRNTRLLEARKLLDSHIDYHVGDICRLTAKDLGTFDIVLFLGVLYHLKHPILALENVCGMCRDMACIESFVTDPDPRAIPIMEYYETTELRGQLDNWVGPNAACLMAFCRTAGFARVDFESALGERAHVTGYRTWPEPSGDDPPPQIRCVENSTTHDHTFSVAADDYVTFYFTTEPGPALTCDDIFPRIGPFGSRPIHVAATGSGWQATCKLPPGLNAGWHFAALRTASSVFSAPLRIGVDIRPGERSLRSKPADHGLHLTRVADGQTFENLRVRAGEDSSVSAWVGGLPTRVSKSDLRLRLNGTDLPAIWVAPPQSDAPRQINALLPSGLAPGHASLTLVFDDSETEPVEIEIYRS